MIGPRARACASRGRAGAGARDAVQLLTEMDEVSARAAMAAANVARRKRAQQRRDAVLRQVRQEFFPELDTLPAAIELERAARGYRTPRNRTDAAQAAAEKRPAVRRRLEQLLGDLDAIPSAHRIRQLIDIG